MTKHLWPFMGLLAVVLGCGPATKPSEPATHFSQSATRKPAPNPRPIPAADFTLTPEELAQQLKDDEAGTAARYRGKVIEVTGFLVRYISNSTDGVRLCLQVTDRLLFIFCNMPDPDPWDVAAPGQTVTIRGTFPDRFILPTLTNCVIVKASGECRSRLTATELGRRCDVDANAWKTELECSGIVLEGVVQEAKEQGTSLNETVRVTFRSGTKCRVVADLFWPVLNKHRIRVGHPIRVVGLTSKVGLDEGEVRIWGAFLAATD